MNHTKEKLILKALMILAVIALIALVFAWIHLTKQINQTNNELLQSFTA